MWLLSTVLDNGGLENLDFKTQIGKTSTVLLESPSKYVEQPRPLLVCPAFSHCSSFPLLLFWHMYTLTLLYTTTQGLLLLSHTHSHLRTHTLTHTHTPYASMGHDHLDKLFSASIQMLLLSPISAERNLTTAEQ